MQKATRRKSFDVHKTLLGIPSGLEPLSALSANHKNLAKIVEKLGSRFGKDFGRVLGRFGEGFGKVLGRFWKERERKTRKKRETKRE